jgi:RNA polymerase sigma factor (sigma-70 family)
MYVNETAAPASQGGADVVPVGLEALYREHWLPLFRLALLLTGSREVAEDVASEAFVRLSETLSVVERPEAYLRATIVNLVREGHRRRTVRDRFAHLYVELDAAPPEIDETWCALQRLGDRHRSALVLRFYLDLSMDEIARAMSCRPATARSLVHRGLARLKKELAE